MARCCVRGAAMMYEYCEREELPHQRVGKVICASVPEEAPVLQTLLERGEANGVEGLRIIDADELRALEPNLVAHSALLSPNSGIADFAAVARRLAREVEESGRGAVHLLFGVDRMEARGSGAGVEVVGREPGQQGPEKRLRAKHVITCAGLHADSVGRLGGGAPKPQVLTFRGRYYQMRAEHKAVCTMNVYPVPSGGGIPVGVHFTPTLDERRGAQMIVGPGACLCFTKEAYNFFDYTLKVQSPPRLDERALRV